MIAGGFVLKTQQLGPKVVLFLHGFPQIWYTWRYQMIAVAKSGYRAIAYDFRGYGLSELPAEPEKGGFIDLVEDTIALLDTLGISKAFLVGTDLGSFPAYMIAVLYPERVTSLVSLGVPFRLPGPSDDIDLMPEGFYCKRWQEPGRAEADFGRFDVKTVIKNIYILFSGTKPPIAREDQEIMDMVDPSTPLPPWFSEEDLAVYASLYEKSGFRYPLQVPYRTLGIDCCGITNPKVVAPTLLVMGEKDYALSFPGVTDYIKSDILKQRVPDLETVFVEEGNHFVHEKLPEQVNEHSLPIMELIKHTLVEVRGLKLHVAEIGTGPKVVLFLHGFPEIWYTWRYQMKAVAAAGYRAIAIDFRGYGLSEQPAEPEKGNFMDLVDDVVALLDTLGINKVFLIGKDFGSITAYLVAVVHPERVSGLVSLGIPFLLPGPNCIRNDLMPSGFYITRWQEPGRAEADFGRLDVKTVVRNVYILFSGTEPPTARDDQEIMDLVDPSTPLPPWFSEEDLAAYASLYEKSGFRFALQVFRHRLWNYKSKSMEDYTKSEQLKHFVPDLDTVFLDEGNHFVHENLPKQVNELIITFLTKHCN
ncbi:hypothetical protein NC652_031836 [Populus alba x Populus x berolinensis]|nr:hypothetical protein NC652_031836 [Populus alba x Populus x berolinensis]